MKTACTVAPDVKILPVAGPVDCPIRRSSTSTAYCMKENINIFPTSYVHINTGSCLGAYQVGVAI